MYIVVIVGVMFLDMSSYWKLCFVDSFVSAAMVSNAFGKRRFSLGWHIKQCRASSSSGK